ncbi:DEAD/DEAH box helicase [Nocardioides glacieisoli]|uniref:Probable helicase HelY n=1 Tax=Nocardioides glacieisoli TaxID=1168730 RepID=A0A4Q2RPC2_9ACTN|nr:DEAD/DEAH box helicase [Nocardioides glacieisoli]RYB90687.1 DEAD/DEAH box helicase [Nocardioides glacieisoli]
MSDQDLTPAERYAAFQREKPYPMLKEFSGLYGFELDDFQVRACQEIEEGRGVLVAAPTGSGKTIVGEFAIHLALQTGRKAFYTTPIKALSNQKYHDLVKRYGADNVGLLTGDNVVNGEAPVVVMTTEVLRNMLYASSRTLLGLGYVVMDEVHYLADRMRGAVWEEVIIHLPESVTLVSLSATVSNAEEFGEWLATVRGETTTILEEKRPVPLFQHVMVGRRLLDLFASSDVDASAGFVKEGAPVNDELTRIARDDWASTRLMRDRKSPRKGKPGSSKNPRAVGNGRRVWIPSRVEVVERLDREGLLPAIMFIFSRAGCDAAVSQLVGANVRLTTAAERDEIFARVEEASRTLPEEDLQVLGYHEFLDGLTRGIAAHHAGILPAFKHVVEELFQEGMVKVVFATETLALGINMPARTVVIEKLSKWNGETHADLTPGEYTQLTGRAGRRGLDIEGHGVVLYQPGMNPREVAGLASTRTYPLRSSFRPSYNMAVNLVHQFGRARSRELLEQSFAQYQADKAVVGLARQVHKAEEALEGYRDAAHCHVGDFMEYAAMRRRITDLEKGAARDRRQDRRAEAVASLGRLRPGDVIKVPAGKFSGLAVVIDPGHSGDEPRPYVVTADRQARRLAAMDFPVPVEAIGRMRIPKSFNGRNPAMRRDLATQLRARARDDDAPAPRRTKQDSFADTPADREIGRLRADLKAHPCHQCPEREDHARWAERYFKLERDTETLRRRVETRTNTVARTFDRVCDVLTALGYLDGDKVTEEGSHLRRIYTDMDLVAAEAIRAGLFEDLTSSELAAVLSALVFEARRADDASSPKIPGGQVRPVLAELVRVWAQLDALERDHKLDFLREPDMGFAWAAWRWAEGDDLDDVLMVTGLSAGDFVRWMKQLLDLCGQVADAAGDSAVRTTARAAAKSLKRGVIAYSVLAE